MKYIKLIRVHQWTKSAFILLPGVFSGTLYGLTPEGTLTIDWFLVGRILAVMFFFSLLASSVYIINDIRDIEIDRASPTKKHRPLAAGTIKIPTAIFMAVVFISAVTAFLIYENEGGLWIMFGIYIAMNSFYTAIGKQMFLIDVFLIALMYVVRVAIGAFAVGVAPSPWLVSCTFFLALFLGFSKRHFEFHEEPDEKYIGGKYSDKLLEPALTVCAGVTLVSYALYTLTDKWVGSFMYGTIPLVALGIFRYFSVIFDDSIKDKNPSAVLLKDPMVFFVVVAWLIVVVNMYLFFPPVA